jgi:spore coat polysaccharide biosynthesis predicted glycosyltransferase SpsG
LTVSADVRLVTAAGPAIGHGHVSRSLSLGEADWPPAVRLELEVDASVLSATERRRSASAGIALVEPGTPASSTSIIVIDRPDPTAAAKAYERNPRVVFDDAETFTGRADIVVQPSAGHWDGRALTPRVLTGYRWVPLGRAWRERMVRGDPSDPAGDRGSSPTVLVCFGGSDPHGITARISPALAFDPRWSTTIVLGHGYQDERPAGTDIRVDPTDLPHLVEIADLAVISAGTIKFEVAAMGCPALLVGVADDQRDVGPAFAATGAARWIGDGRIVKPEHVRDIVADSLADPEGLKAMTRTGRMVVDGLGGDRLAAEIATLVR